MVGVSKQQVTAWRGTAGTQLLSSTGGTKGMPWDGESKGTPFPALLLLRPPQQGQDANSWDAIQRKEALVWHGVNSWSCRVTPRSGTHGQELPRLVLQVPGRMEGACAHRGGGPEAGMAPHGWWSLGGWDEKKGVRPPMVTVFFLRALVEVGAGVAQGLSYQTPKCGCQM